MSVKGDFASLAPDHEHLLVDTVLAPGDHTRFAVLGSFVVLGVYFGVVSFGVLAFDYAEHAGGHEVAAAAHLLQADHRVVDERVHECGLEVFVEGHQVAVVEAENLVVLLGHECSGIYAVCSHECVGQLDPGVGEAPDLQGAVAG